MISKEDAMNNDMMFIHVFNSVKIIKKVMQKRIECIRMALTLIRQSSYAPPIHCLKQVDNPPPGVTYSRPHHTFICWLIIIIINSQEQIKQIKIKNP